MTAVPPGPEQRPAVTGRDGDQQDQLLASSAVMAAGTVVSRFTGYFRSLLLAAALGNLLHADLFTIGNTVPNMLYILLAGGIFNAVLRPILIILTLPVTILTLGLFTFIINAGVFLFASTIVKGFTVDGFGAAIAGSLLLWLINWFFTGLLRDRRPPPPSETPHVVQLP